MKEITMPKVILVGEDALTKADKLMLQYRYKAVGEPFTAVYSYGGLVKVNKRLDDVNKLVRLMEQGLSHEFLDDENGDMPIPRDILNQAKVPGTPFWTLIGTIGRQHARRGRKRPLLLSWRSTSRS
jgi:hypothetical protein